MHFSIPRILFPSYSRKGGSGPVIAEGLLRDIIAEGLVRDIVAEGVTCKGCNIVKRD